MKKFLKEVLSARSGQASSKRICGCLGWIAVLGIYIYCTMTSKPAPEFTDFLIGAIVALLGVDSVTNVFKKPEQ